MSTPLGAENHMSTGTDKVSEVLTPPPLRLLVNSRPADD